MYVTVILIMLNGVSIFRNIELFHTEVACQQTVSMLQNTFQQYMLTTEGTLMIATEGPTCVKATVSGIAKLASPDKSN